MRKPSGPEEGTRVRGAGSCRDHGSGRGGAEAAALAWP